jgi:hypothetical protein
MTKDQYLRMVEQTGEEIDWERCPPEIDDFPESVHTAVQIFNTLGDRVYADVGFTGKDFTNLDFLLDNFYITEKTEKDWIIEVITFLEKHSIKQSQEQIKAQYDKIKKK